MQSLQQYQLGVAVALLVLDPVVTMMEAEEEKEEEGPSHLRWTSARTRALLGHDLFPREGAADCHVASQRPSQASWG